jgi:hypothetical protein
MAIRRRIWWAPAVDVWCGIVDSAKAALRCLKGVLVRPASSKLNVGDLAARVQLGQAVGSSRPHDDDRVASIRISEGDRRKMRVVSV